MMSDALPLMAAAIAGVALGVLFFGGLWWTIPKGLASTAPALWFGGSFLLRTGVVLGGFYWAGHADWTHMVACLLGFVLARPVVLRATRRRSREAPHAPHA
jgi:F1F0 ATPase subunit 2